MATKNPSIGQKQAGNCYAASEALWHALGGAGSDWKPMVMRLDDGGTHWFLRHKSSSEIVLDPSAKQFLTLPDYTKARGCGFLTRIPSAAARRLLQQMTWKHFDTKRGQ
jgi:hypothetical protein